MSMSRGTGKCPLCGLLYCPDEPDDRRYHRSFHARVMKPRRPKPDARLDAGDVRVDGTSPRWLNCLVYDRAHALKREEGFDFTQWGHDRPPRMAAYERDLHAILLVEQRIPVGVVGFTFTNWENRAPGWHMFMAWLAPDWRRKGLMSRRWAAWRQSYGDFTLEQPNRAMLALAEKMKQQAE
jgi:hypothetical protein